MKIQLLIAWACLILIYIFLRRFSKRLQDKRYLIPGWLILTLQVLAFLPAFYANMWLISRLQYTRTYPNKDKNYIQIVASFTDEKSHALSYELISSDDMEKFKQSHSSASFLLSEMGGTFYLPLETYQGASERANRADFSVKKAANGKQTVTVDYDYPSEDYRHTAKYTTDGTIIEPISSSMMCAGMVFMAFLPTLISLGIFGRLLGIIAWGKVKGLGSGLDSCINTHS